MAHKKQKQSTGSWKSKRDKHQTKKPKGPKNRGENKIVGDKKSKKKNKGFFQDLW